MNSKGTFVLGGILFISVLGGFFEAPSASGASGNLIFNPGIEDGSGNTPDAWSMGIGATGNTFDWVSDDVHSGTRALKMVSTYPPSDGRSMEAYPNTIKIPAHSRVEVSLWMKANDVVRGSVNWYQLRIILTAYDALGNRIKHQDILSEEGSFPWKKIQGGMIAPEGTDTMQLAIRLTSCTGTVWIDDVEVEIYQEVPAVDLSGVYWPVVLPQPWKSQPSQGTIALHNVAIIDQFEDERVRNAVASLFVDLGIAHEFVTEDDPALNDFSARFILGDSASSLLDNELSLRFPGHEWSDLEDEGYLLVVAEGEGQDSIYAGANSSAGRFYAVQTLRQLIVDNQVFLVDVLDKPTLRQRGITMGYHWFKDRLGLSLERMSEMKFNYVWLQGSALNFAFWTDNWRQELTDSQKVILRQFIERYRQNFIDVWIGISPRGKSMPLQHSSDEDINAVVRKMDTLYGLGLRHFGLQFDDLYHIGEGTLLVQEDIDIFNDDIASAHVYFIREVHRRLTDLHPDIAFNVIPLDYVRTGNMGDRAEANLRQYQELSPEIQVSFSNYYDEDVVSGTSLTGRPRLTLKSNFFTSGYTNLPEYIVPHASFMSWTDPSITSAINGTTWMMPLLHDEDRALVSWRTSSDYAWAPERYDPNTSFQLAAARYLVSEAVDPGLSLFRGGREGFETGDFSEMDWRRLGDVDWFVTPGGADPGLYGVQAGDIGDSQRTSLAVQVQCDSGEISFFCKVSSEKFFDSLSFYIDNIPQGKWSGEQDWTQVSIPVESGTHTFRWDYDKDSTASSGQDTAWLDEIVFPVTFYGHSQLPGQ
jgi:hypothetical protein